MRNSLKKTLNVDDAIMSRFLSSEYIVENGTCIL